MSADTHITIVGGGASGLMAAVCAARLGAHVTIAERQDRVGRKILATGNGRCNLTNVTCSAAHFAGGNVSFVKTALESFTPSATMAFFAELGAPCREEDGGKVYPLTGQASTVLDVLRFECTRLGVEIVTDAPVSAVSRRGHYLHVKAGTRDLRSERAIVCAGGRAVPQLGGGDSGIQILSRAGHGVVSQFPVLVPVRTDTHFGRQVKGTKVIAGARLFAGAEQYAEEPGEVLFTEYGLSGPPIIQLSLRAAYALHNHEPVRLILDLLPGWPGGEVAREIERRRERWAGESTELLLLGLIHKRLIPVVLGAAGLADMRAASATIPAGASQRIEEVVRGWELDVTGTLAWSEAHVMAGGVSTADFNPATLESRLVPGLYAAGEVLDIVGDCGGHNLQWAWASARLAAQSACA